VNEVKEMGAKFGLEFVEKCDMPANNFSLFLKKK